MPLKVKICGITRAEDATVAIEAGADALGFVFFEKSKRWLGWEAIEALLKEIPRSIDRVGVFVDPSRKTIERALDAGINRLQFHGSESPDLCEAYPDRVLKAFRVRDRWSLEGLAAFVQVPTWLLDSYVPGEAGGTGARFNWDLAIEAKRRFGHPFLLAGGLTPENVAEAVGKVAPYGVDVSSGVESAPGIKDPERVRAFIRTARNAELGYE